MVVAHHAHLPGITTSIRVLTRSGRLRPSKLLVALLTEAFGIVLTVYMGALRDAPDWSSRMLRYLFDHQVSWGTQAFVLGNVLYL